jgi:rSAM/selenodomain-associated transferase 1
MREWLGKELCYCEQKGPDLGYRMYQAFADSFDLGFVRVLIVGSDSPGITETILNQALDEMCAHDLVLGPAHDGGYYLAGLNRPIRELFQGVNWGTGEVLEQTLEIARFQGLSIALTDPLDDIDRPEDLQRTDYENWLV